jgi:hypothetical protein
MAVAVVAEAAAEVVVARVLEEVAEVAEEAVRRRRQATEPASIFNFESSSPRAATPWAFLFFRDSTPP